MDNSNQPHGPSGTVLSQPIIFVLVWQDLIAALRHALDAILLFFLWFGPAFQLCLRTLKAMPRSPSMLLGNNITFVDALNRNFSLQYEQFRYWPVVSAFLQCKFQNCPGALRITHKRFAVFKEMRSTGRGVMIPFDEWEQMIRPGQRVLMSMSIGQEGSNVPGHSPTRNACPSCGFEDSRSFDSPVWKKCADCGQLFLRLDPDQASGAPDRSAPQQAHSATPDDRGIFDRKEISAFSRVHDLTQLNNTTEPSVLQQAHSATPDDREIFAPLATPDDHGIFDLMEISTLGHVHDLPQLDNTPEPEAYPPHVVYSSLPMPKEDSAVKVIKEGVYL